ncbi:hypothetical protein [Streptomyces sp. NPDC046925]|uniref:hypothetical protein n=1 Tax=Streptomyces sp. NPDC046925 TaxID=3155375 RepID=UPI0033FEFE25
MSAGDWITIDRHWCLVEDGSRVVPETDPEARWLHWSPGAVVARDEAERLGAVDPESAAEPEEKKAPPAANKQRTPTANKRR